MSVRYYTSHGHLLPEYICPKCSVEHAGPPCQRVLGADLDRAVGDLLVETVSPLALEVALAVQDECTARAEEADHLRRQQVERARYEAELAQRRYLRVDPDNRLVADSLEADWNQKLRALADAQEDYEHRRQTDGGLLDRQQREQVLGLAIDFPRLWREPGTPQRERTRMGRLLRDDVTLLKTDKLVAHVRFRGGASHTLELPLPLSAWQLRKTDPAVVADIDRLLDHHTEGEIARILTTRGLRPGVADRFTTRILYLLRRAYGLTDRFTRLRRQGLLTLDEIAVALGVHPRTVKQRQARGQLVSQVYNDKGERLYAPPDEHTMIACLRCGTPMPERGARGQLRKYCGVTCRTAAYASRRAAAGWVRVRRRA